MPELPGGEDTDMQSCLSFRVLRIQAYSHAQIIFTSTFQFKSISQPGDSYIMKDPIKKDIYLV